MTRRVERRSRPAIAILGAIVLSACGSVRYPEYWVLNVPPPAPASPGQNRALGSIEIGELGCPDYLCEGRIVYRPAPEQLGFYEYHRWAVDPREAMTALLADRIRARSIFDSVTLPERGVRPAYILRGRIERLEEVDEGEAVYALCTISAEIVEMSTRSVIWRQTASETVPMGQRNMTGLVTSLAAASQSVVDRLVASIENELATGHQP